MDKFYESLTDISAKEGTDTCSAMFFQAGNPPKHTCDII